MARGEKGLIYRLGIVSAFFTFAHFLYIPLLAPMIEEVLQQQTLVLPVEVWLGIIFAVYPLTIIFAMHAMGALSDEIGRRNILLVGIIASIASVALVILASSPWLFILARALEALGYNTFLMVMLAKVNDHAHDKNRGEQDGKYLSISQIGNMLAPPVGAFLAMTFFPALPFISGLVILTFLFVYLYSMGHVRVKRTHTHAFDLIKNLKIFLGFRKLKGMAILGIVMHAHSPALILFLPLHIRNLFPNNIEYVGLAFFFLAVLKPLQFVAGKIVDKHGKARMTILGCLVVGLAFFLLPLANTPFFIFALMLVFSLGSAFWNVGAWTIMSDVGEANHIEGHVVGSYTSIAKVGDFVATLAFGAIAAFTGIPFVFSLCGYLIMLGILFSMFFLKDLPPRKVHRAHKQ